MGIVQVLLLPFFSPLFGGLPLYATLLSPFTILCTSDIPHIDAKLP